MKILRSIAAIVAGWIVAFIVIGSIELANFAAFRPDDGTPLFEKLRHLSSDRAVMKAHLRSMPENAVYAVVLGWMIGAPLGGAVAAMVAARAPAIHAGIIGAIVVLSTFVTDRIMKKDYDYMHPEWALFYGLIMAALLSLIAGTVVARLRPVHPANAAVPAEPA